LDARRHSLQAIRPLSAHPIVRHCVP